MAGSETHLSHLDSLTQEHVPDSEDWWPGQSSGEDAEEPLGHVEDGFNTLTLQMSVDPGSNSLEQTKQNVSV